ncbi:MULTISPECIES: hypothetical protein [unclassified Mesorhizobium]|uniref:hypothetical protein n=1 Tax=unclassified Mesorhizobium TaxID=325217 RepID=UPI001129FA8E|nr:MULTISPECIES: hypothetical protein [unclassified Mesorhizobium]MBZ9699533.1 hypothetical protein [Mesorhizobium sp. CO1-1-3]MBZ9945786.1 hypothetical protein [Mesorhizobium sp. BR1-1-11]TPJ08219.1 hypothetical protein FJ428_07890 [Mesorhizobium sp. B2-8-1]
MDNYTNVKVVSFTSPSQKTGYRIFDKPAENRLMITSSIGNAMGQGALKGLTLMDTTPPEILFEQAAVEYLASTGRTCVSKKAFLIVQPQFEVQYDCSAAPAGAATTVAPVPLAKPKPKTS